MSEIFSLEDILGPPKSSIRLNYEFNIIGKNTHLIGTKSTSYPPIHDDLVEKEIVKEEEGDWLGWGLNLVIGIAVTAACAVVAVAAAPVTVTVAVVAGCAAVGSAVATTAIAVSDYHDGKPHPRAWWEAAGGILFGAGIGAIVGAELYYFPSMIAGTAEVAGIQASMWAGASSMLTSVAVPKLATGLGYGLLGMNAIFGLDQASGVGDGETLLRRQNPELYDNLAMLSMILTEGYSSVGARYNSTRDSRSQDNDIDDAVQTSNKVIKNVKDLNDNEVQAVIKYTGDDYYNINKSLREKDTMNASNQVTYKDLKSALDKASLPEDMTLYRGTSKEALGFLEGLSVDELLDNTFIEPGFMSTTKNSSVAKGTFKGNMQMVIEAPKGSKGFDVSSVSQYANESEILFQAGQKMVIKEAEEKNGVLYIRVRIKN